LAVGKVNQVAGLIELRAVVIGVLQFFFSVDPQRHFVVVTRCQGLWSGNGRVPS
jgi:hypothetical protein